MNSSLIPDESADILIVDDTPENLRLLSLILQEQGYQARKALSGERALRAVETVLPELILLDISMPEMDGYEVCRRLKANAVTAGIPIIFISALNQPMDKVTAFEVGGVDYITKPFQEQEVLARVENHLKLDRMQRQLKLLNQTLEDRVNQRTGQLQDANAQLRRLESELRYALVQKQELVDLLETQNAALQETAQLKDEFLKTISHELRTPLNSVIGYVQLILEGFCEGRDEEIQNLEQVSRSAHHLLKLIEDILTISHIKSEQISLQLDLIDVEIYLDEAIDLQQSRLLAKDLNLHRINYGSRKVNALERFTLNNSKQPSQHSSSQPNTGVTYRSNEPMPISQLNADRMPLIVRADPLKLRRIFINVIDNAIKFTDQGEISIVSDCEFDPKTGKTMVIVTIEDTGIGIPADQQHKLFHPFTMIDGSTTRKQGGIGLGLVIAKHFLELMTGHIVLESAGTGCGTKVTISLPLAS